jgi:peptidoglycan/LPS O-acetylase OafA/YrhL
MGALGAMFIRSERCWEWLKSHRTPFRWIILALAAGMGWLTRYATDFTSPKGTLAITFGYSLIAIFYVCVLLYAVTWSESRLSHFLRLRSLCWLGSIAYGVYLFHLPILYFSYDLIWSRPPAILTASNFLITVAALAITLLICQASWILFERPLVKIGHRQSYEFERERASMAISQIAATEG